jgi:hypothetical protein
VSIESVTKAKEGLSTVVQNSNTKLGETKFKGTVGMKHPQ